MRIWLDDFRDAPMGDWGVIAPPDFPTFVADTEANARAKMLIYLLEQGLVKP